MDRIFAAVFFMQFLSLFLCIMMVLVNFSLAQPQKEKSGPPKIMIEYSDWNYGKITITEKAICRVKLSMEFDSQRPMNPNPTKVESKEFCYKTNIKEVRNLVANILKTGFFELEKDVYGGSEDDRYYPYEIKVTYLGLTKNVLYRSHPDAEKAPKQFDKVAKLIMEFEPKSKD